MKTKWYVDVFEDESEEIRVEIRFFDELRKAIAYGKSTGKRYEIGLQQA